MDTSKLSEGIKQLIKAVGQYECHQILATEQYKLGKLETLQEELKLKRYWRLGSEVISPLIYVNEGDLPITLNVEITMQNQAYQIYDPQDDVLYLGSYSKNVRLEPNANHQIYLMQVEQSFHVELKETLLPNK